MRLLGDDESNRKLMGMSHGWGEMREKACLGIDFGNW
jgi:hypothetical protein